MFYSKDDFENQDYIRETPKEDLILIITAVSSFVLFATIGALAFLSW